MRGLSIVRKAALLIVIAITLVLGLCHPAQIAYSDEPDTAKTVRVGYYTDDPAFQKGSSDDGPKSGYGYEYLQSLAPYAGWNYDYAYSSRKDALNALRNGDIDVLAGVTKNDAIGPNAVLSESDMGMDGEPRYIAVSTADPNLVNELNEAQAEVNLLNPNFESELQQKYYAPSAQYVGLSDQEKQWLKEKGSLSLGYLEGNLPISDKGDNDEPEGVAAVVKDMLHDYLDVKITAEPYRTMKDMQNAVLNQEIDMAFPMFSSLWESEKDGLFETASITYGRPMIVYLGAYTPEIMQKVALADNGLVDEVFVEQSFPDSVVVNYPEREQCLEAIQNGEVNCLIGCASSLQRFLLENPKYSNFNIAYLDESEPLCLSSSRDFPILSAILNKAVAQFDETLIANARVSYSTVQFDYTLADMVAKFSPWIIGFMLVIIGILAIVFYAYIRKSNTFKRQQTEMQNALLEALDSANTASDAKTSFLSSMSHDIRTPMNGIIGMTAIAESSIDDQEKVKDCLKKIESSSNHLLSLINEILDVSKIESGKLELNEESFVLSDMIDDLILMNKPLADAKDITMQVRAEDVIHENVHGDRTRLQQVYSNLVSNAIKYTPSGGHIEITLNEKASGKPGVGCYSFSVKDNGIGMEPEYIPHIFEAFSRAESKQARKVQGTGLGMPIALNIVRKMNGDIKVDSELGKGSTFVATVFLKQESTSEISYDEFKDLPILIVDDDDVVCKSASLMLTEIGMKPEWTTSGAEAVDMIEKRYEENDNYFAAIVDWIMPGMDGVTAIKEMRRRVPVDIPIIIASAYDWSTIEDEAKQIGVSAFINKPLFKSRLVSLFNELINPSAGSSEGGLNEIADEVDFTGKRALLVEDNDLNAEIVLESFAMTGLEIDWAKNGKAGLDMLANSDVGYYDCVFMDIQMPVMNGHESAKAMRALDRPDAKTIPIFAMSADAFVDDVRAAKESGMNEHFAKPLDFKKIFTVIAGYFK